MQIRLPNHLGIAGAVFTSNKSINIPYAYSDLRFNPAFDKKTGFFPRLILCVPIVNKYGKSIGGEKVSTNLTVLPLTSSEHKKHGSMLLVEDISNEKRLKSTMSRYMDPGIANQLLSSGSDALGGQGTEATVLFADIRSFTTI